jgi:3-hydroxyisobutyrate dehydrogenase-like beta-hydroxyacid dehydrogenase
VAASNATVLAEALLVAQRAGADLDALVQVMAAGSGGSVMLDLKAEPMRRHDYTTLFKLDHMLKDIQLCLDAAAQAGIRFEFAQRTAEILSEAAAAGHGDDDFAALIEPLERQTGTRLPGRE